MSSDARDPECNNRSYNETPASWPARPKQFPDLMRPIEAAQYLRLDELESRSPRFGAADASVLARSRRSEGNEVRKARVVPQGGAGPLPRRQDRALIGDPTAIGGSLECRERGHRWISPKKDQPSSIRLTCDVQSRPIGQSSHREPWPRRGAGRGSPPWRRRRWAFTAATVGRFRLTKPAGRCPNRNGPASGRSAGWSAGSATTATGIPGALTAEMRPSGSQRKSNAKSARASAIRRNTAR